jgi:hypothetical protein
VNFYDVKYSATVSEKLRKYSAKGRQGVFALVRRERERVFAEMCHQDEHHNKNMGDIFKFPSFTSDA